MRPKSTVFDRNPKKTLAILLCLFFLIGIVLLEFLASHLFGLGKVVLYASHPIYGYRPIPNQIVSRDGGKTTIKINNLSLRANQDWLDSTHGNKTRILFLGDSVTYGGSYITNQDLFSTLAFKKNSHIETANAGVNAWGILNVHGLIKNLDFMPADIYITVVPEGDFYRGLSRIGGQPFWTRAPRFAIEEAFQHLIYILSLKKNAELNIRQLSYAEQEKIANLAALALKEYDDYLKKYHHQHYIFITPTQAQVVNQDNIDTLVQNALKKNQLHYIYIKNKIPNTLTQAQKINLFHDSVHLSKTGHQLWAQIIEKEVQLN